MRKLKHQCDIEGCTRNWVMMRGTLHVCIKHNSDLEMEEKRRARGVNPDMPDRFDEASGHPHGFSLDKYT